MRAPLAFGLQGLVFQVLMGVLDQDDGPVDHGPDGDGDAAQGHDVGVDALQAHGQEGDEHGGGQGEDGHQRAAQMQQEDAADQGHDEHLLDELMRKVVDRAMDQEGTIIGRDDAHVFGQSALRASSFFFTASITSKAFCP